MVKRPTKALLVLVSSGYLLVTTALTGDALGEDSASVTAVSEDAADEEPHSEISEDAIDEDTAVDEESLSEAVALFRAGEAAFRQNRPADAQISFRRSLRLEPRPSTAFNLAITLRATNDLVEAVQLLDQLLQGRFGEIDSDGRVEVESLRRELHARLATVTISTSHPASVLVEIDSLNIGVIEPGGELEHLTIPGSHTVSGSAEGVQPIEQTVEVSAGEEIDVVLAFEHERPRRWWIWVLTVSLVTVAASTAIALSLTLREPRMETNPLWGGSIEALHGDHSF